MLLSQLDEFIEHLSEKERELVLRRSLADLIVNSDIQVIDELKKYLDENGVKSIKCLEDIEKDSSEEEPLEDPD
jgi:hypothetical protein